MTLEEIKKRRVSENRTPMIMNHNHDPYLMSSIGKFKNNSKMNKTGMYFEKRTANRI